MNIEDLYTLDACEAGAEVQIDNPFTGEKTGCYITVKGRDSSDFAIADKKGRRKMLEAISGRANPSEPIPDDEYNELERTVIAETLADATIGWRGFKSSKKEVPFSREKVLELYLNSPPIREQVDKFIGSRANFIKG